MDAERLLRRLMRGIQSRATSDECPDREWCSNVWRPFPPAGCSRSFWESPAIHRLDTIRRVSMDHEKHANKYCSGPDTSCNAVLWDGQWLLMGPAYGHTGMHCCAHTAHPGGWTQIWQRGERGERRAGAAHTHGPTTRRTVCLCGDPHAHIPPYGMVGRSRERESKCLFWNHIWSILLHPWFLLRLGSSELCSKWHFYTGQQTGQAEFARD